jgi:prophage DNA circulation protein
VEGDDLEAGRRVQLHEYPQRDKPYAEDLGRATRGFTVTGFVIGDDVAAKASRLLDEFEKPGPATLVHPWLGTVQVTLRDPVRMRRDGKELGVIRFDLSLVEAGELQFPSVQASTQAASRIVADKLTVASVKSFASKWKVAGVSDFVRAAAESNLGKLASTLVARLPGLPALGDVKSVQQSAVEWVSLVKEPSILAQSVSSALGVARYVGDAKDLYAVADGLLRFLGSTEIAQPADPAVYTVSRQQATANEAALNGLVRQTLLAQALGTSSLVGASVYDEVVGLRSALVAAIDAEQLLADDGVYQALAEARAAAWADLTARSRDAARMKVVRPVHAVPALVLSHRLYGSAQRGDEIVARNRVRHPGFVPPVDLKVLAS